MNDYKNDPAYPDYLAAVEMEHPDWPPWKHRWAAGNRVRRLYQFLDMEDCALTTQNKSEIDT